VAGGFQPVAKGIDYRVAFGGGFGGAYTYGCDWLQNPTSPWDKYLNWCKTAYKVFQRSFQRPTLVESYNQIGNESFLLSTTLIGGSQIENDNYTLAAYDSLNAILGVVYCTEMQTITVDLSKITGPVKVQWYDQPPENI